MKGFDNKYKDFPDYILKITKQIWEGKDVNSISEFYSKDIPVRSPFGVTYGNRPVIDATFATLKEFPNRQLLGEEVIWNGNDERGYHSSHRILSKGTHLGDGFYGKPTKKDIYYRVIADCACKNNQVYDEWIVRDQGAIVRQLGYTPKEFAKHIIEKEGGETKAKKVFNLSSEIKSEYTPFDFEKDSIGEKYSQILKNIFSEDYKFTNYARAASIFWPGNKIGHGREEISNFWNSIKNALININFSIEHVGWLEEEGKNSKVSIRWFLNGLHANNTYEYEQATNKNIFIMGINHAEIVDGNVIREWVLFDEVAIWKQLLMK
tara:strand:- start:334 stop:1296 length:963 start_codon:yes stop_codon:yes gene_type:complete